MLKEVHFVFVGVGRAAEPEMLRRRFDGEIPCLAACWISGGRVVKDVIRRLYTVGTAVRNVIFDLGSLVNGAARRRQTWSGLNGYRNSMEEPANIGVKIALTTP